MNRYEPSIPRAAFGVAAIAMTALTISMAVILPAWMEPGYQEVGTLAASRAVSPAPTEVVIHPARINVVGVRGRELVSAQVRDVDPKCKQQEI
jgi:hypothetical protein